MPQTEFFIGGKRARPHPRPGTVKAHVGNLRHGVSRQGGIRERWGGQSNSRMTRRSGTNCGKIRAEKTVRFGIPGIVQGPYFAFISARKQILIFLLSTISFFFLKFFRFRSDYRKISRGTMLTRSFGIEQLVNTITLFHAMLTAGTACPFHSIIPAIRLLTRGVHS